MTIKNLTISLIVAFNLILNVFSINLIFPGVFNGIGKTYFFLIFFNLFSIFFIIYLYLYKIRSKIILLYYLYFIILIILINFFSNYYLKNKVQLECGLEKNRKYTKLYFFNSGLFKCKDYSYEIFEEDFYIRKTYNGEIPGKPKNIIFFFGGSTGYSINVPDDYTIPSILAKNLKAKGVSNKIYNFSMSGLDSSYELNNLITILRNTSKKNYPNFIIFYDGFNDSTTSLHYSGESLNIRYLLAVPIFFGQNSFHTNFYYFSEFISNYSTIYEVTIWKFIKTNYYQKKITPNKNYIIEDFVNIYIKNINFADYIGKKVNAETIFFLQPMAITKKVKTNNELIFSQSKWSKPVSDFYSILLKKHIDEKNVINIKKNSIMTTDKKDSMSGIVGSSNLALKDAENKIVTYNFFNISDVFNNTKEEVFIDIGHINSLGNQIVGKKMSELIINNYNINK